MTQCIWCKGVDLPRSLEHIIPEALGCPPGFELSSGEVCRACNNGLAHLDDAMARDFDMVRFLAGVPRKGGRPPKIDSRGNLLGTIDGMHPTLSVNMEPYAIRAHDGSSLAAFRGSSRNISATLTHDTRVGRISFSTEIGRDPKFVRGITKIALNSVAKFLGSTIALEDQFDAVRSFVRKGVGARHVLMMPGTGLYRNQVWPPSQSEDGNYCVTLRLANCEFLTDLSPSESNFPQLHAKAVELYGAEGFAVLPPK